MIAFAPGCTSCEAEAVTWQTLYQERRVSVVGLAVVNSLTELAGLRRAVGITFPVYTFDIAARSALDVHVFPTIVLVDTSGVVREVWSGSRATVELRSFAYGESL